MYYSVPPPFIRLFTYHSNSLGAEDLEEFQYEIFSKCEIWSLDVSADLRHAESGVEGDVGEYVDHHHQDYRDRDACNQIIIKDIKWINE